MRWEWNEKKRRKAEEKHYEWMQIKSGLVNVSNLTETQIYWSETNCAKKVSQTEKGSDIGEVR